VGKYGVVKRSPRVAYEGAPDCTQTSPPCVCNAKKNGECWQHVPAQHELFVLWIGVQVVGNFGGVRKSQIFVRERGLECV